MSRILIVDDEKSIRRTLGEFLRADGYQVVEAEDADEALRRLQEAEFDVVVTDIILPRVTGIELLRRILAVTPEVQVVLMTGEPTVETAAEALRIGAADYLFKPINKAAILRVVAGAAKLKALQDEKHRLERENRAYQENLERLVAERTVQLSASESNYRLLIEQIPDLIWRLDAERRVLFLSPNAARVLEHAPLAVQEDPRKLWFDRIHPDDVTRVREAFDALFLEGKIYDVEYRLRRADGSWGWLHDRARATNCQDGVVYADGISSDVTEKKQLEAQFLRAQRLEGIGALASGIAHDLNNILAPVLMTASLLHEATDDPEKRELLDTIEGCARRGADIIKQLLTFARGASGARVPLPFRHLLRDMDKLIRETFPRDICPVVMAPGDLWPVVGDPTQLHQVLLNLCVNARDAMPDGGTITLEAHNQLIDAAGAALQPGACPGPHVCLRVSDTGAGISEEHLDRIFDPFFTTKEIGRGTGLGLATVLGILRGHGGFVRVHSLLGRGTTFELFFPASPEDPKTEAPVPLALGPLGRGELILVVDDEEAVRECLRRILERSGYQVRAASQGEEGLAFFTGHADEISAVLTDMMMPVMNGPAMIHAMRARKPYLRVLGMTGLPDRAALKGLETLELSVLLNKPFSEVELLHALEAALRPSASAPIPGGESHAS